MHSEIDTSSFSLAWSETPWDAAITGYPVWQINHIEVRDNDADKAMQAFENARGKAGVGLVCCRLDHSQLRESMFLEAHGFRFIEMLYQPELRLMPGSISLSDTNLTVRRALAEDLPVIEEIAGSAFFNERFHVDPRLGPKLGNQRYINWVHSSSNHPTQNLYVLSDAGRIVSFFITEMQGEVCYWHLNAVAPDAQGQGYGKRAWRAMIGQASDNGAKWIRTSIVARNNRVLNLYAKLGFRFPAPLMTLHWVSSV